MLPTDCSAKQSVKLHVGTWTSRRKLAAMSDKARKEMGGEQLQQVLKEDKIQGKKHETK